MCVFLLCKKAGPTPAQKSAAFWLNLFFHARTSDLPSNNTSKVRPYFLHISPSIHPSTLLHFPSLFFLPLAMMIHCYYAVRFEKKIPLPPRAAAVSFFFSSLCVRSSGRSFAGVGGRGTAVASTRGNEKNRKIAEASAFAQHFSVLLTRDFNDCIIFLCADVVFFSWLVCVSLQVVGVWSASGFLAQNTLNVLEMQWCHPDAGFETTTGSESTHTHSHTPLPLFPSLFFFFCS